MMNKKYLSWLIAFAGMLLLQAPVYSLGLKSLNLSSYSAQKDTARKQDEEEIEVTGELLSSKLKGRLQEGFSAYMKGDFALAEYKFSSALKEARNDELLDTQNLKIFGDDFLSNANRPIFSYLTPTDRKRLSAVYYMRGISQARQGKTDSAKISMRKSIKINAKNVDARVDYSLLELQSGNLRKAEKQIKRIKKLLKKCKDESAGDCDNLNVRFAQLQTVYAQTSVN